MNKTNDRREFIIKSASAAAVVASSAVLGACGDSQKPAEYRYGVASGDPLADRVILWTHAKSIDSNLNVPLTYEVATDVSFTALVKSGPCFTSQETGFTTKVDVTGLSAGTTYYYRFVDNTRTISPVGVTRTLPKSDVSSVKFAVFSCSLYSQGFFNAYAAAAQSDAQYAIHLGDYIYEYSSNSTSYGNADAVTLGRVTAPANEIVSLEDYRTRYATYRSDASLQALHAKMPLIAIWDDHEFANNAYVTGAENHNPATQGDWAVRKANASRAYHEWMPIRTDASGNLLKIYRRFDFGSLMTLHMLDTRIEGRTRQYDNYGDADGGVTRYLTALGTGTDANQRIISTEQQTWLTDGMKASSATWQILGNQVIMARMTLPANMLAAQNAALASPTPANQAAVSKAIQDFLTAKATRFGVTAAALAAGATPATAAAAGAAALTSAQVTLLDAKTNPRIPYNLDAWDGYTTNREAIYTAAKSQGKRLVTLSGDSHNGWFTTLTNAAGEKVGVEFAGSSVTSPGFEAYGLAGLASSLDGTALIPQLGTGIVGKGLGLIDDLNYVDTIQRGYMQLTVSATEVKGEFIYVSTVKSTTYSSAVGKTITVPVTGDVKYV
jgi:alkaline phosphatase D